MHISAEPPKAGTTHVHKFEWSGNPTKQVLKPYIEWMNTVNSRLADVWGIKLAHFYLTSPGRGQMWIYEPGKPPHREI